MYIGRQVTVGNYLKLDNISSQFNGTQTRFNLTTGGQPFYAGSSYALRVALGGVLQEPEAAYTIDENQIIFATAPASTAEFYCIVLGTSIGIGVPGENTVKGSKLTRPFNYEDGLLYLDDATNRVGINTETPQHPLSVYSSGAGTTTLWVEGNARITGILSIGQGTVTIDGNNNTVTASNITVTNLTAPGGVGYATTGYVTNSLVGYATEGYVTQQINNLIDGAPGALDTLNELAAALNDDANFATTVTNSLAQKANLSGANFTGVVTTPSLQSTSLRVSGISTLSTIQISSGIITATSGIITYYGDGSRLSNVASGVGIRTAGGTVGTGITLIDLRGVGVSTVTASSGIATVNIIGGGGAGGAIVTSIAPPSPSDGQLWFDIDNGVSYIYYQSQSTWVSQQMFEY